MKILSVRAWSRPIYLLQVLDSLRRCRDLNKYKVLISCDYLDKNNSQQILEAIHLSKILDAVDTDVVFHEENLGCTGNFRFVLDKSFEEEQDYAVFLEDDSYVSIDILEYFEQVVPLLDKGYFAGCTLNRPCHQVIPPNVEDYNKLVSKNTFEGANAFCLTRKRYKKIQDMGGVFGVDWISEQGKKYNCRGQEWLKEVQKSDRLGWDTPFEKYFRDSPCLFPILGRTYNIGKSGLHLNYNQYMKTHCNENWAHHPLYVHKILNQPTIFDTENIQIDDKKYVEDGYE